MSSTDFETGSTSVLVSNQPGALRVPRFDLIVIEGPDEGARISVDGGSARIGTARGNHLVVSDRTVSRNHCEVSSGESGLRLLDLGSTNGTFVDGRRVRDVDVAHGTVIRAGSSAITIELGSAATVELPQRSSFGELVGTSAAMRRVYAVLEKVSATDATVLLFGETGTGKEMVAQALHDASPRREGPFITLDCGAIPESLIEAELFGHVRGAFTGANNDRRGVFEEAKGGTLFIDEIGELPLPMQPKLLRALEARRIRRVGSNQYLPIDVRVVAATNKLLHERVNRGLFRDDLYYRLAVVELELPPLRARLEDIPMLSAHFLERFTGQPATPPPEMLSALAARAWPGNLRELRNVIERAVSLGWSQTALSLRADAAPGSGQPASYGGRVPIDQPLKDARIAWTEQFEAVYVKALLERTGGNVTRAAELAGVNRRFLQRMMARLGIR